MQIEKLDYYGRGIAKVNNKVTFIHNALPLEDVDIKILKESKKYNEARVIKYLKKSPDRVDVKCKYYNICGGCNISHLKEKLQEEFKENKIKELSRFIDIKDYNKIEYSNLYNYRNKIVIHIDKDRLGLYKNKSNELVEIDKCLLVNNKINDVIKVLKEVIKIPYISINQLSRVIGINRKVLSNIRKNNN